MLINSKLINLYKYKRKLNAFHKYLSIQATVPASDNKSTTISQLRILFFGTDQFSLPSLRILHDKSLNTTHCSALGVVTSFKSPANCVRTYAEQHRLPLQRWPIEAKTCQAYDLGVVVSFGHMIPEQIINSFPLGMINVHASLLPRWRGAAPIIYAIMHNDKTTGVSIMKIAPKRFDVGDVLAQHEIPIPEDIKMPQLHSILASEGAHLLYKVISNYPSSFSQATPQDARLVTYAPKITSAITRIDWSSVTANQVYNRYRALYSFKYLQTQLADKAVQLIELNLPIIEPNLNEKLKRLTVGSIIYQRDRKCLLVCCADNRFVEIHKVRVEGKKIMSAEEFNNGFLKKLKREQLSFLNISAG